MGCEGNGFGILAGFRFRPIQSCFFLLLIHGSCSSNVALMLRREINNGWCDFEYIFFDFSVILIRGLSFELGLCCIDDEGMFLLLL